MIPTPLRPIHKALFIDSVASNSTSPHTMCQLAASLCLLSGAKHTPGPRRGAPLTKTSYLFRFSHHRSTVLSVYRSKVRCPVEEKNIITHFHGFLNSVEEKRFLRGTTLLTYLDDNMCCDEKNGGNIVCGRRTDTFFIGIDGSLWQEKCVTGMQPPSKPRCLWLLCCIA